MSRLSSVELLPRSTRDGELKQCFLKVSCHFETFVLQACQTAGIVHRVQKLDTSRMSVHCTMLPHTLPTNAYSILTTTVSGVALG